MTVIKSTINFSMVNNIKFIIIFSIILLGIAFYLPNYGNQKIFSEQINQTQTKSSKLGVATTVYNNPLMGIRFNKFNNWDFLVFYGFEPYCWGINTPCKITLHPDYISYPEVAGFQIYAEEIPPYVEDREDLPPKIPSFMPP